MADAEAPGLDEAVEAIEGTDDLKTAIIHQAIEAAYPIIAAAVRADERAKAAVDNERLQRELDHVRGLTQEEILDEAHGALLTAANERAEAAEAKAEAVERVRAETLAEVDAAIRNANPEEGKYAPEWHRALRWALGRIRALGGPDA